MFKLTLFGSPTLEIDHQPVAVPRRKVMALLIYLAVSKQTHRRDKLATILWPETNQKTARSALRRELAALKEAIGNELLVTTREEIALSSDADIWVDIDQFHAHITACADHEHVSQTRCKACLEHLGSAAALYQDNFLAGFTLSDSPEFDEWQFFIADGLRRDFTGVLGSLVQMHEDEGDFDTAIGYARRQLTLDKMHEATHQTLMRLYALAGQQAAALRQYDECVRILAEELDVPPVEETTLLYEAIRTRRLFASDRNDTEHASPVGTRKQAAATDGFFPQLTSPSPVHNLPAQPTSFIGREDEVATIQELLIEQDDCRLLTLIGPGGMGKTRLAIEAVSNMTDAFPDGIYFVGLAGVDAVENINFAIADTLQFQLQGADEPMIQLANYLKAKISLLLIDNLEHLLGGAELLARLLRAAPKLKMIVTSREALTLQEEWLYPVGGMQVPNATSSTTELEANQGVQLFAQCARRADASFHLTDDTFHLAAQVVRLVDGMPLALELAGAWIGTISCREIVKEIEESIDFLATAKRNVPERHRSLRAVLEQTWLRLIDGEQDVVRKLSVFRGGCRREASEEVAGATLPLLSLLAGKALLRRTQEGRYEIHELIRQFAAEQLQLIDRGQESAVSKHSGYYMAFLQQRVLELKGIHQRVALTAIVGDIDNIRAAWEYATRAKDSHTLYQSVEAFWLYSELSGALLEGEAAFQRALLAYGVNPIETTTRLTSQVANLVDEERNLIGLMLAGRGYLSLRRGNMSEGQAQIEMGVSLLRQVSPQHMRSMALALMWSGFGLNIQGQHREAIQPTKMSLEIFTTLNDQWGIAWCSLILGIAALWSGNLEEARRLLQDAYTLCHASGDQITALFANQNLAVLALTCGEYNRAREYLDEEIAISQDVGDRLGEAYGWREYSKLHVAEGDYEEAQRAIHNSLEIFRDLSSSWDVISVRHDLGTILRLQGDYQGAEELYQEGLLSSRKVGHPWHTAKALSEIGCLAFDRQEYGAAEQHQKESLTIWRSQKNEPEIASVLRYLGHATLASHEHVLAKASEYFVQALQLSLHHQLAPIALDIFVGIAKLLLQMNPNQQAIELLTMAEQHVSSTHVTKKEAQACLIEHATDFPHEIIRSAREHAQAQVWHQAAQKLIDELAVDIPR